MTKIPKDREIIIIINQGNYLAVWSEADERFIYANPQTDMYKGKWNMKYFENEYISEDEILGWRDL